MHSTRAMNFPARQPILQPIVEAAEHLWETFLFPSAGARSPSACPLLLHEDWNSTFQPKRSKTGIWEGKRDFSSRSPKEGLPSTEANPIIRPLPGKKTLIQSKKVLQGTWVRLLHRKVQWVKSTVLISVVLDQQAGENGNGKLGLEQG